MEWEEVGMSKEELQKWIRDEVHNSELISPDVLKKCKLLQSILERREKQTEHLLKLCKSVAACEAVVKKLYSMLGWEFFDTDSDDDDYDDDDYDDDDDDIADYGHSLPSPCDSVRLETQVCCSPAAIGPTPLLEKLQDRDNPNSTSGKNTTSILMRKPVVSLTRLPECKLTALLSSAPQNQCSEQNSLSSSDYDMEWEPEEDSSDSEFSVPSIMTRSNQKRKMDEKNKKHAKSGAAPQASTNTKTKTGMAKMATSQARTDSSAKSNGAKTVTPQANRNTNTKSSVTKTSTPPNSTTGQNPVCIETALSQSSGETNKKPAPSVPQREICLNMHVLARKGAKKWQRGQIVEILTKDDGRVKYKVNFEERGRILVSGHHIAFDCMPKVEQLFVGSRVVVKCPADQPMFCPGILGELPNRKNRMRFLIFTDDHTPVYVGLPSLYLVCRPLTDPLDDILDDNHKSFMKDYLNKWPATFQIQYKVGQIINVEVNGVQEKCEVQEVDCSLIKVVFQKDQHMEWIYRGSMRLEHMIKMSKNCEAKHKGRN